MTILRFSEKRPKRPSESQFQQRGVRFRISERHWNPYATKRRHKEESPQTRRLSKSLPGETRRLRRQIWRGASRKNEKRGAAAGKTSPCSTGSITIATNWSRSLRSAAFRFPSKVSTF